MTEGRSIKQDLNNDLERRKSNVYDGIVPISRDSSPLNLPLPPNNLLELSNSNTPEIMEEYGNVYTDDQGNLVRPPFIKLDPRERHNLLRLKRSIDTQESIQKRMKYMIDPNETISSVNKRNQVDMATQTHDVDYLSRKLHFKRKQISTSSAPTTPAAKKPRRGGFFSGEFKYDIPKSIDSISTVPSISSELNGYLGNLSKVKFNNNKREIKPSPLTQVIPQQDEDPTLKKFSSNTRVRDREQIFSKTKATPVDLKLDEEYLKKSESVSNIIKLKDSLETDKRKAIPPSSGFKFDIKQDDINDILKQRKDNDDLFKNSKVINQKSRKVSVENVEDDEFRRKITPTTGNNLFENDSEVVRKKSRKRSSGDDNEKPSFSFGKKSDDQPKPPIFSFGKKTEEQSKPAQTFSLFGKKADEVAKDTTPKFSFGKKDEAPKFTFGKPDETSKANGTVEKDDKKEDTPITTPKPAFSFGENKTESSGIFGKPKEQDQDVSNDKKEEDTTAKPSFGFSKKDEDTTAKPIFSFGKKEEDAAVKPTFSFGKKEDDKPTFSFGKKDEDTTAKPTFSFGKKDEKSETSTPTFSFGKKEEDTTTKPVFSFGKKEDTTANRDFTADKKDEQEKPAPTFSFGQKSPESSSLFKESQGKSLFGESTTTKSNVFSIDKPSETKTPDKPSIPSFSFGASKPSEEAESEKPSLFSQPSSKESTGFSFGKPTTGATTSATTASSESTGTFKFGADTNTPPATKAAGSTPSFSFNLDKKEPSENKPFTFGQPQTTTKPNFSFGGNNNTNGSKSGFTFGGNNSNNTPSPTVPSANPNFKFAAGVSAPGQFNFSNSPASTTSSFMSTQPQSFGQPVFGGQSTTSPFGQPQQPQQTTQPAFGGQPASTSPFTFGVQQGGSPGPGQFSFGNGSKEATPDPASIFKSHATAFSQPSPGVMGQNNVPGSAGAVSAPGSTSSAGAFAFPGANGAPAFPGANGAPAFPGATGAPMFPGVSGAPGAPAIRPRLIPRSRRR
ncbi:Nucleoporin NSP1 [Spathaspora sp. JA1]|nr:Nucleoporin NSP1 [Spathaspora sp. JA1]